MQPLRYLSEFAGIDACSVAWRPLGWTCAAVCEIDPFASAVLAHRYPGVPNLGDVTTLTDARIAALGPLDIVVGGSPCQDFSLSGKRAGLDGERSGLFHDQARSFHAARLLCGARWCVWENVLGALSSNDGRDFARVVSALAGCDLAVPEGGYTHLNEGQTLIVELQTDGGVAVRGLTPREAERVQGFPDDWTRIPWRGRDAAQCPDTPRFKALGNSMPVGVMRWLGERIAAAHAASIEAAA